METGGVAQTEKSPVFAALFLSCLARGLKIEAKSVFAAKARDSVDRVSRGRHARARLPQGADDPSSVNLP
jgi:hypothetical protein